MLANAHVQCNTSNCFLIGQLPCVRGSDPIWASTNHQKIITISTWFHAPQNYSHTLLPQAGPAWGCIPFWGSCVDNGMKKKLSPNPRSGRQPEDFMFSA